MISMTQVALLTALFAGSFWLGSMLFLSAVLAPIVFKVLSAQGASHLLRALFPRYYKVGIGCGITLHLAMTLFIIQTGTMPMPVFWTAAGSLFISLLGFYSLLLIPRINEARDAGTSMKAEFDKLHQRSIILNVINIMVTITVLINIFLLTNLNQV